MDRIRLQGMDSNKLARKISIAVVAIRILTSSSWVYYFTYAVCGYGIYSVLRTPADVVTGQEYIRVYMNKEWKGFTIGTKIEKVHRDELDKYNYFVTFSVLGFLFILYMMFLVME